MNTYFPSKLISSEGMHKEIALSCTRPGLQRMLEYARVRRLKYFECIESTSNCELFVFHFQGLRSASGLDFCREMPTSFSLSLSCLITLRVFLFPPTRPHVVTGRQKEAGNALRGPLRPNLPSKGARQRFRQNI